MAQITYLELSKRDYKFAKDMMQHNNYNPCGRFCQQSVEKRLKHYIEQNGDGQDIGLLGTHNLRKIYERVCKLANISVDRAMRTALVELTSYYYDTNYPGESYIELTKEDATFALQLCEEVNGWIDELTTNPPTEVTT